MSPSSHYTKQIISSLHFLIAETQVNINKTKALPNLRSMPYFKLEATDAKEVSYKQYTRE